MARDPADYVVISDERAFCQPIFKHKFSGLGIEGGGCIFSLTGVWRSLTLFMGRGRGDS